MSNFEQTKQRYYKQLGEKATQQNKVCIFVDNLDDDEVPNPTLSDLQALRYIFISANALRNIDRLNEACSMVGRDKWTDSMAMTNTASSYEFHLIFRVDVKLCKELLQDKKYSLCTDLLIGMLFAMRRYDHGFHDTDAPEEAQEILTEFGSLWTRVMASEEVVSQTERRLDTLAAGYVRSPFRDIQNGKQCSVDVLETIQAFNYYTVDLGMRSRKILFDVMESLANNLSGLDYTLEFGKCPDIQEDEGADQAAAGGGADAGFARKRYRHEVVGLDDEVIETEPPRKKKKLNEETLTREKLSKKTVVELKKMCKERGIYCSKGTKRELIDRMLNPAGYREWLKRKHHYEVACKQTAFFLNDEPQEVVNESYTLWGEYDPRKYKVVNGKVVERREYDFERRGNSITKQDEFLLL